MRIRLAVLLASLTACGGGQKTSAPPTSGPSPATTDTSDAGATAMSTDATPPPPPPADQQQTEPQRPAPLAADKGKPAKLKVVAIKVTFQKGMLRDTELELKKDGSLWFDGKKLGKISKNKIPLTERPMETTVRSDGYLEETGEGYEKGLYMKMSDDTLSNPSNVNVSTQLKADGSIITSLPGQAPQQIGTVTGDLKTPEARRTALVVIGVELARPPDFSGAQKQADEAMKKLQDMQDNPQH